MYIDTEAANHGYKPDDSDSAESSDSDPDDSDDSEDEEHYEELSDSSESSDSESDDSEDSDDEDIENLEPARKKHRLSKIERDIKKYQDSTKLIIPHASFARLVREIAQNFKTDLRFTPEAFECIQEAAEAHIVEMFQDVELIAFHCNRQMVTVEDMDLATALRSKHRKRSTQ